MADVSILWRRLDRPGHESCRLVFRDSRWNLEGTAVFAHEAQPCGLDYRVVCDAQWRTLSSKVAGWIGGQSVDVALAVDVVGRRWRLDGVEHRDVTGCIDVDLNFSPSTNLLPIRRLGLAIGQEATVRAAWLRFPSFALEPLEQLYRRIDAATYRYESAGGQFVANLEVNAEGFVAHYPDFCRVETGG